MVTVGGRALTAVRGAVRLGGAPGFDEYQKKTDRVIPVFELTPE
jgi:hypothetical protein